jgi:hypothetical protein
MLDPNNATDAYKASHKWFGYVYHYNLRCPGDFAWHGPLAVRAIDDQDAIKFLAKQRPGCEVQYVPYRLAIR